MDEYRLMEKQIKLGNKLSENNSRFYNAKVIEIMVKLEINRIYWKNKQNKIKV